jgi:predicted glycogen debranching enzyme
MSRLPAVDLARDVCADPDVSGRNEWLVTNGIGGYAMGTVAGFPTRRYHGLLVAALDPPLGRTLLVSKLDAEAAYLGGSYALAANQWAGGATEPQGFVHLDRFHLDGTTPVWTFALADALVEKRVWMQPGANTTYVRYDLVRASAPLRLRLRALVGYRDYHSLTHAHGWTMQVAPVAHGVRVDAFDGATPFFLRCNNAAVTPAHDWVRDLYFGVEAYRGLGAEEDVLHAATFEASFAPGGSLTVALSTDEGASLNGSAAYAVHSRYDDERLHEAGASDASPEARQLVLAADQFVVRRPTEDDPDGRTIIAGYPWFSDWGRDTMIALPGLLLTTGRTEAAARVLRTFARFVDRGMIPNRFPDAGHTPEYNTVDATLWLFEAARATVEATDDDALLRDLFPVLERVVEAHRVGTRYGIRVDPDDGLLSAGEPGVQLTWMDAKVGDWVVTPRIGKPVEVNALWYHALRTMADFARRLGREASGYDDEADGVAVSFDRFWNAGRDYCFDVIDGPDGREASLRPNQLFAVSLAHGLLSPERQRAVVDACAQHLLTPHGLRSLAPDDPEYTGRYGGSRHARDGAYHQGTVWGWLIGPFVEAHLRVYGDEAAARSYLRPLVRHLGAHGLGSVSEIFDGDAPFAPRGCPAQAWSVAELLRMGTRTGLFLKENE